MKKGIFMLAAVGAAACCLGACTDKSDAGKYDKLNEMLNANYSQIVLTVTNTFDENTSLKSEYTIKYSDSEITVEYTVEKFATIDSSLDGTFSNIKTTLVGEAKIEDGVIVSVNGDNVDLIADIATPGLDFKKEYFADVTLTDIYFIANVNDASGFLGSELTCSDMKVTSTFGKVFNNIRITYKSASGNKVEYKYVFTI